MPQRPPEYPQLRSTVRKGDIAEISFLARAMRFGFNVCKPFNSDSRYDVLVEAAGRYSRVQVKSGWQLPLGRGKGYGIRIARRPQGGPTFYRSNETDFFAAYVARENAWYIIPQAVVSHQSVVVFFPLTRRRSRGRFEIYREAWDLFLPKGMAIVDLKAAADPGDSMPLLHLGRDWPGYNPENSDASVL